MLAIIDYGSGNLRSVAKAFERVAGSMRVEVTAAPERVRGASHIVLPGVGAFADCMAGLTAIPGMLATLEESVLQRKKYFLGICVGMQMLFERGYEQGVHKGLGWLKGEVKALAPVDATLKIPHIGWNNLTLHIAQPLTGSISTGDHVYFVHSYQAECSDASDVVATTDYGQKVTAIVARGNIMGTQFHPEKSQKTGLQLLHNFIGQT